MSIDIFHLKNNIVICELWYIGIVNNNFQYNLIIIHYLSIIESQTLFDNNYIV